MKMYEKCRLCLGCLPNGPRISIMDDKFHEELQNVFHSDFAANAQLPDHVCDECRDTVSYIHSYCQQVRANQEQLLAQANESVLHPVENIKVESLYDADVLEVEVPKVKDELAVNQHLQPEFVQLNSAGSGSLDKHGSPSVTSEEEDMVVVGEREKSRRRGRRKCRRDDLQPADHESTDKQDSAKGESVVKQQENDQMIKDFFTLECEICSEPLESFPLLLDHYREVHNTRGYVRCCDKQFFRRYILVDHIEAHRGTIRCEICQKSYKTRRYLALHIAKSHSSEADRPFKCSKCHVSYPKQYLLRAHELLHVQEQCHICQKVLSNTQSLKVHLAQMHGGDGNQICATCGKVFRTKPAMERHIKEHLGLELVERLQCEHCKKWFNGKYNLKKHIRFLHKEGGQVFTCDLCQHVSPNSRALANHKQRIHVEEKYECEYCGKRFKRRPNLREHIASHTNVPLYTCEICKNRTFNSKANYFTHRKNQHPQEWEAQKRLRTEREMSKNS